MSHSNQSLQTAQTAIKNNASKYRWDDKDTCPIAQKIVMADSLSQLFGEQAVSFVVVEQVAPQKPKNTLSDFQFQESETIKDIAISVEQSGTTYIFHEKLNNPQEQMAWIKDTRQKSARTISVMSEFEFVQNIAGEEYTSLDTKKARAEWAKSILNKTPNEQPSGRLWRGIESRLG